MAPPAPSTAEQIRDAFRPSQHRVFTLFTAGQDAQVYDWLVTGWTQDQATIAFTALAQDGVTVLEPATERSTAADPRP